MSPIGGNWSKCTRTLYIISYNFMHTYSNLNKIPIKTNNNNNNNNNRGIKTILKLFIETLKVTRN